MHINHGFVLFADDILVVLFLETLFSYCHFLLLIYPWATSVICSDSSVDMYLDDVVLCNKLIYYFVWQVG